MKQTEDVISCLPEHVERGISKYNGQKDLHLQAVIKAAGYEYVPYLFSDKRVLLILPKKNEPIPVTGIPTALAAFIYLNEEVLSRLLNLE
jgi:hypothetical protein